MDTRGFNEKDITQSLDKITNAIKATGGELPPVTSDDNGKILKVVNGDWNKGAAPTELPEVSGTDNGKILTVVNGAWDKATASGGGETFHIVYTENSGSTTADKTGAELLAAIEAGKRITCDMIIERSKTTVIENVPLSSYSIVHDVIEETPAVALSYKFSFLEIISNGGDMNGYQVNGEYDCLMSNPIQEYDEKSIYMSNYEASR